MQTQEKTKESDAGWKPSSAGEENKTKLMQLHSLNSTGRSQMLTAHSARVEIGSMATGLVSRSPPSPRSNISESGPCLSATAAASPLAASESSSVSVASLPSVDPEELSSALRDYSCLPEKGQTMSPTQRESATEETIPEPPPLPQSFSFTARKLPTYNTSFNLLIQNRDRKIASSTLAPTNTTSVTTTPGVTSKQVRPV